MSIPFKNMVLPLAIGISLMAGCATQGVSTKINTAIPDEFVTLIAKDGGIHTDRRRMSPGFYDAKSDQTFVTWMGENADAYAAAFDHKTNTWSEPKMVGASPKPDKHNYPHMVKDADGRIIIFYGCHNSPLYMTKAPMAHSIDGEWEVSEVAQAPNATYPMPIVRENGEIIVFFRETMQDLAEQPADGPYPTDYRPLKYVVSTDDGATWSESVNALDPYPRLDNLSEIYAGEVTYQSKTKNRPERLLITWALAGGGSQGFHNHDFQLHNVYFASFDPVEKVFYSASGVNLGERIDVEEMETHTLAAVTKSDNKDLKSTGYSPQASFTDAGNPLLTFRHVPDMKSAYWNGSAWDINTIVEGKPWPQFDHDLEKTGDTSFKSYVMSAGAPIVRTFETKDNGANWLEIDRYTFPNVEKVAKLILVDNYHPEVKYLVTELSGPSTEVTKPTRDIYAVAEHAVGVFPELPDPATVVEPEAPEADVIARPENENLDLLDNANLPVMDKWESADIGEPLETGFAGWEGNQLVLAGSGSDIWNNYDQFHFVYSRIAGDFTIIAKVDEIEATHEWAKVGIMIRGSLEANSAEVMNTYTPRNGVNVQWRLMKGMTSNRDRTTNNTDGPTGWVKMVRVGNTVTGYDSQDGVNWFQRNKPVMLRIPDEVYVGIAITSHSVTEVARGFVSNISIEKN